MRFGISIGSYDSAFIPVLFDSGVLLLVGREQAQGFR